MGAAAGAVGTGFGYAKESLTTSWLFGSTESTVSDYDEKHYFLIPFQPAACGYTLYSMRCLPEGTPPVNDLPKRRIIHLPNEHGRRMIEELLCHEAAATAVATDEAPSPMGRRLNDLADGIDELDKKAFHGALLIGGLVALANPVAGGILAAKAMLPSIGLFLSRYGLKQIGDTLHERGLRQRIQKAESDVLKQFQGSDTTEVVDPLLVQLDKALNTKEHEYDPVLHDKTFDASSTHGDSGLGDRQNTITAIINTYDEVLQNPDQYSVAGLGPEDVRWLRMLRNIAAVSE